MGSGASWQGDRVAGPFAVTSVNGEVLCCSAKQTKSRADSKRKRALREDFIEACKVAGLVTANHRLVTVDGISRPRGAARPDRVSFTDMGHVIPDEMGGAFCLCNIVPQDSDLNRRQGVAVTHVTDAFPREAWAAAVRSILIRNMTGTKRARVA